MLYIKITAEDGTVLGAEELKEPIFVTWQEKNKIHLACPAHKAQGIVAANGDVIYRLDGKEAIPYVAEGMVATEIDAWEYEDIINTLGNIDDEPTEPESPAEPDAPAPETPMTAAQMRLKIKELTSTVDMLTGCILEMSEAVYA